MNTSIHNNINAMYVRDIFYLEFIPTNIFMPNSFHSVLYRKRLKQNPFIERFTIFISRQNIIFLQYFRTNISNRKYQ